jgi:hypothetical protein
MTEEEIINVIKDLFKEFDIGRLHKFEYKGKNKNGKNKYKIRYTPMFMTNCYIDETIVEK